MTGPSYVAEPTVHTLQQLLDELASGELVLPMLYRSPVWSDDQRLQGMQQICDGIPIGSALVWRTHREELQILDAIGPHALGEQPSRRRFYRSYLLDGSHRFFTLFGFLRPLADDASCISVDEYGEEMSWRAGFDLLKEELVILGRDEIAAATWVPAPLLLDSLRLLQFQRMLPVSAERDRWIQRSDALAESFRTYKLPVVPLVTEDFAVATRAFARVNDRGTLRAEMELTRASLWRPGFDLEERLATVKEHLVEVGWESLELEWVFAACKVVAGFDAAELVLEEIRERLREEPAILELATKRLAQAARWLAATCGVGSPLIVPRRQQVMELVAAFGAASSTTMLRRFWRGAYADDGAEPNFEVPMGFPIGSPRIRTMALRLAALGPLDVDGAPIDATKQLADHGVSALLPISPSLRGCAGRIFTRPGSGLREALIADATLISPEILQSHAITYEAAKALGAKDHAGFLQLRAAEVRRLEESFYAQTQSAT